MSANETFKKYKTELNTHDFERLLPLLSKDCNFLQPMGSYHGLAEVRHGFEKSWAAIHNKKTEFSKVSWIVESDFSAVCTYSFNFSGLINELTVSEKGIGTNCFRLESGEWKIALEHLSFAPAEENGSTLLLV